MNDDIARKQEQNEEKSSIKDAAKKAIAKKIKSIPLKTKLIIVGIIASIVLFILIIIVLTMPLFMFFFFENGNGNSGSSTTDFTYIETNSKENYWWPVGGSQISTYNEKEFATGAPTATTITSSFGYRDLDGDGQQEYHSGVDISDSGEHYIIAVSNGVVVEVVDNKEKYDLQNEICKNGTLDSYGNYVLIEHSNGTKTRYAHLKIGTITVSVGDEVKQGQIIASMGTSGCSTGVHLHFEVRNAIDNQAFDPNIYISVNDTRPVE